jgi:predicted neutral ceramidase superfamily lipid hydrolase
VSPGVSRPARSIEQVRRDLAAQRRDLLVNLGAATAAGNLPNQRELQRRIAAIDRALADLDVHERCQ